MEHVGIKSGDNDVEKVVWNEWYGTSGRERVVWSKWYGVSGME